MREIPSTRVWRVRLLRWGIAFEVEGEPFDPVAVVAEAIAELADTPDNTENNTEEYTEDNTTVGGGSSHNFERDTSPVSPDDRYAPWEDRFGFH